MVEKNNVFNGVIPAVLLVANLIFMPGPADCWAQDSLRKDLVFHVNFDGSTDAQVSAGDGKLYTAPGVAEAIARQGLQAGIQRSDVTIAKGAGKSGDAIRFANKSPQVLVYLADNIRPTPETTEVPANWSGTFSFWMRLDPKQDLKPGFCDPMQLTQHAWNNAAMFVDFDDSPARDFRLGLFPNLHAWNPEQTAWEKFPIDQRPMVTVKNPPFSRTDWTHVAFTFENLNAANNGEAVATLYLNGKSVGMLRRPMPFQCDLTKAIIMLGVDYVGDMDEFSYFRRALTPAEVKRLAAGE